MGWRLFRRAQSFHHRGAFRKAAALYARALASDPNDSGVRLWLAAALAERGRFEEAREQVEAAAGAGAAPLFLARVLYDAGQPQQAREALAAYGEDPQNQQARALAALCRWRLGEEAAARETWAACLPATPWLLARVVLALEEGAKTDPEAPPEAVEIAPVAGTGRGDARRGLVHLREGRWEAALEAFRAGYGADATDPRMGFGLGISLYYLGHLDPARRFLLDALDRLEEPFRSEAQATLGKIAVGRGETVEAVLRLRRAIAAGAAEPDNYYALGLAFLRRGNGALARRAFEKCVTPEFVRQRLEERVGDMTATADPSLRSG